MACEDYPCCGHTPLDPCPRKDSKGRNIITCCECGKRLSARASSSICSKCQCRRAKMEYYGCDDYMDYPSDFY